MAFPVPVGFLWVSLTDLKEVPLPLNSPWTGLFKARSVRILSSQAGLGLRHRWTARGEFWLTTLGLLRCIEQDFLWQNEPSSRLPVSILIILKELMIGCRMQISAFSATPKIQPGVCALSSVESQFFVFFFLNAYDPQFLYDFKRTGRVFKTIFATFCSNLTFCPKMIRMLSVPVTDAWFHLHLIISSLLHISNRIGHFFFFWPAFDIEISLQPSLQFILIDELLQQRFFEDLLRTRPWYK